MARGMARMLSKKALKRCFIFFAKIDYYGKGHI
jgi:hypothetical protein